MIPQRARRREQRLRDRLSAWLLVGSAWAVLGSLAGCQPATKAASKAAATAPAKVDAPVKEAELTTVKLTPEAETRLGITLTAVEQKKVPRTSTYGGEVVIPPGRLIVVSSPFIGTLKLPAGADAPIAGARVKEGQPLFLLVPILSPEAKAQFAPLLMEAEGTVKQAQESLNLAEINYHRQENLVRDRSAGKGALVDAEANYKLAKATLKAAEDRHKSIQQVVSDSESGSLNTQTINAPAAGTIQNVHVTVGQKVAAGALLFDVASLDPIWIKVPVYVGDLPRIAPDKDAGVGSLADVSGTETRPAKPVAAPPSGDPLSATVHVFYQVENKDRALRPGERVGVTLPLKGDEQNLVVPRAALLRDIQGDTWVYENTAPHAYARRRVLIDRVVGDLVALTYGPKSGAKVVTNGAAELFGTEFGLGK